MRQVRPDLPGGSHYPERQGRVYDRQAQVRGLRRVRQGLPHAGDGHAQGGGREAQQVHRLRHLRQGLPHGHPGGGGEISYIGGRALPSSRPGRTAGRDFPGKGEGAVDNRPLVGYNSPVRG